jgi:anthranilate synthase component II
MKPRIVIVDNNDSFTYNLVQMVDETGLAEFVVRRYKDIDLDEIAQFDKILISPGPGIPSDYPVLKELILKYGPEKSILGICLGHQAIAEASGLTLYNMEKVRHGIRSKITLTEHAGYLYDGVPRQFCIGLYHSWAVAANDGESFNVTAYSIEGIIMGLAHKKMDLLGVQFHPESFMTEYGAKMITNWIKRKRAA